MQTENIKKTALEYLKHNISVIPVARDKKPLIKWQEFQTRIALISELDQWIKDYPDMQLGIVTGKISNLIVVDIDDPKIDLTWLPETAIVKTGSGGFHYYYAYTSTFSNKARIKESIDIRADGGYVIAPPSYNLKGQYIVVKKMDCQPFPVHLFTEQKENIYIPTETEYPGYGQGQRNNEMTKYIGHLVAKVHPSEWKNIAWKFAKEANQKNVPPINEFELNTIFQSICQKEKNSVSNRWYKQIDKKDIRLKIKNDYKSRYTWGTRGLDTSLAIIKRGNFIIVGAKRGSGKTTFTFDMACKNALLAHRVLYISLEMEGDKIKEDFARKYAGWKIAEEYDYEIPEHKQIAFERKIKEINSIEYLFFRGMRRGKSVSWENIVELINEFDDLDLIFIDNLDLIEGEPKENDLERQKRITKNIMGLTAEKQIPIVLIHHHRKNKVDDKKNDSDELAGSGKIGDNADIILKISKCADPDAPYPEKYKSRIYQQKGRGYPEAIKTVYFIKGSFEDEAPFFEDYDSYSASLNKTDYFNE